MKARSYVLVTPVRNEEATIGSTLDSVLHQTILPREWVIVSDASTDHTDEIVKTYTRQNPLVRLLRLENRPVRNFASVVVATELGIAALNTRDYDYLGLLDADIRFGERYYESILCRFSEDPHLGVAGGWVIDCHEGRRSHAKQNFEEVAGAVQFFRRECFESLGGLVALYEGGWDTITCVRARMNGFRTRTFPEIEVDHLKPRNWSAGTVVDRFRQYGERNYALGNHPIFETVKCTYRCFQYPFFVLGFAQLAGYISCYLRRRSRVLSPEIVRFRRQEQMRRLFPFRNSTLPPRQEMSSGCRTGHLVTRDE